MATPLWKKLCVAVSGFAFSSHAGDLKLRVGIEKIPDSWIVLGDGSSVVLGSNVSFVLGHTLLQDGNFAPYLMSQQAKGFSVASLQKTPRFANPTPAEWMEWAAPTDSKNGIAAMAVAPGQPRSHLDAVITPVVETFLYSSGARSNRITYGFSPEFDNPYRHGSVVSDAQNEFVPKLPPGGTPGCEKWDFFNGIFNALNSGVLASNFGSDADEGTEFEVFGYGIGFRQKTYSVRIKVRLDVKTLVDGKTRSYSYETLARGADVWLSGSYKDVSLGIEIHRRETLVAALNRVLPILAQEMVADQRAMPWSRRISHIDQEGRVYLDAGRSDGLDVGMELRSAGDSLFRVLEVDEEASILHWTAGSVAPQVDDLLEPEGQNALGLGQLMLQAVKNENPEKITRHLDIPLPAHKKERAESHMNAALNAGCLVEKVNFFTKALQALMYPIGLGRFFAVFDQKLKLEPAPKLSQELLPRVGILGSGVDYNDGDLRQAAQNAKNMLAAQGRPEANPGYDFISLDARPSDDNGHGTAAAKLFAQLVGKKTAWALYPIKTMGPRAETHSGAVYDGFAYAAREKLDVLIVPWAPGIESKAYFEGIRLAQKAGVKVFVPQGPSPAGAYKTGVLLRKAQLDAWGRSAVEAAAAWLKASH